MLESCHHLCNLQQAGSQQHCPPPSHCPWVRASLVRNVVIGTWSRQRLEYEADVIGAAFGKAAGCSSEDILYAMSCIKTLRHIV